MFFHRLLAAAIVLVTGCGVTAASRVTIKSPPTEHSIMITPALRQALDSGSNKVALRAMHTGQSVVAKDLGAMDEYLDQLESTLIQKGFVVRDRALLERVLGNADTPDYTALGNRIDTDLVLEIVEVREGRQGAVWTTSPGSTNWMRLAAREHGCFYTKLRARAVLVRDGSVGGKLVIDVNTCDPPKVFWMGWNGEQVRADSEAELTSNPQPLRSEPFDLGSPAEARSRAFEALAQVLQGNANAQAAPGAELPEAPMPPPLPPPSAAPAPAPVEPARAEAAPAPTPTPAASPAAAPGSLEERLAKLKEMLKQGVITKNEHDAMRKKVLSEY